MDGWMDVQDTTGSSKVSGSLSNPTLSRILPKLEQKCVASAVSADTTVMPGSGALYHVRPRVSKGRRVKR